VSTVLVAPSDLSTVVYAIVEADGTEHLMDFSEGVHWDMSLRVGAPGIDVVSAPTPLKPGARTRIVNIRPRTVDGVFWVQGATQSQLRDRIDRLAYWLDPTRGEARLRCYREDGDVRDLYCRLADGLDIDYARGGPGHQRVPATLEATDDPYAYDTEAQTVTYTIGGTSVFFGDPFLPIRLSSDDVIASTSISNTGTAEAYPVWTINGPGSNPLVIHVGTGEVWQLAYTLALGEQIIVDTRPPARRGVGVLPVRSSAGDNLYPYLVQDWLWTLPPGDTPVQIEMSGATADSSIVLEFTRRWLTL
jgi:hypothetical protein